MQAWKNGRQLGPILYSLHTMLWMLNRTRSDILLGQAIFRKVKQKILFHFLKIHFYFYYTFLFLKSKIFLCLFYFWKICFFRMTDRQRDRHAKRQTNKRQTDRQGRICASLYTTIETKGTISFNQGKINGIATEFKVLFWSYHSFETYIQQQTFWLELVVGFSHLSFLIWDLKGISGGGGGTKWH